MISLADLRARKVTPVWQEAVAVVQELIQTVRATTGSAELLPDLEHIALIPNGDVVALPGSARPVNPVQHAAILLQLLIDDAPVPPELNSFVEKNLNPATASPNVAEFSRALAFYERPGRRSDVERLVGRASAADTQRRADQELELLKARAAETVVMEPPAPPPTPRLDSSARRVIPLVAALVLFVGAAGTWLLTRDGSDAAPVEQAADAPAVPAPAAADPAAAASPETQGAAAPTDAPAAPPAAPAAVPAPQDESLIKRTAAAISDAVGVAARTLTGRRETIVRPAAAPAPAETKAPERAARPRRRPVPSPVALEPAPPAAPVAAAPGPDSAPVAPSSPAGTTATPSAAAAATAAPLPMEEPATVYTASDGGVLPPVMVRPVLPKEPPRGVPPEQIGTIEVLVDESGDVAQVKLISPYNRYQERMLVSAAKMWKFRPAYRDGKAVRYRTRVRLTL